MNKSNEQKNLGYSKDIIANKEYTVSDKVIKRQTICKDEVFEYTFNLHTYNMKSLKLKIDTKKQNKGAVIIKVANELGEIVIRAFTEINKVDKDSWLEFKFPAILTNSNKPFKLIVEYQGKSQIDLLIGKNNIPCIKYNYEVLSKELEEAIKRYSYKLDEIYNSSGWKMLVSMYKFRDKIIFPIFKAIKLPFKLIKLIVRFMKPSSIKKAVRILKREGFKGLIREIKNKTNNVHGHDYQLWLKYNQILEEDLVRQREYKFSFNPKFSIIVPTYNTPEKFLVDMIESVTNQTYENWELCIADASNNQETIQVLKAYENDKKIKIKYLDENLGISGNTNEAVTLATGEYLGLFDHDDLLTPNALFEMVKVLNEDKEADFIYSDEDKINETSTKRFDPNFKPDFAIDTLRSYNYICHFTVLKKELFDNIGGFRKEYDGAQDHDLFLRATEKAKKIVHIPKILYHWRVHENSTAKAGAAKMYAFDAGINAIQDSLDRNGIKGNIEIGKLLGTYRINYELIGTPLVSILIPTKDHIDDLDRCIQSIIEKSTYKNYEIIIIENNSTEEETFKYYESLSKYENIKVVYWKSEFNYSAINNFGAKHASGEIFLLLNNDIEIINKDWIEQMLQFAQREDVGAVGAKLYYPDDTIQHGGVIMGLGGVAGHSHKYFLGDNPGYSARLFVAQNLSGVTAACLMVRKDVFEELNGLDEGLKVAFNDVDFCLRIRKLGKLIVWTPFAELYHHESKSRGDEDTPEKIKRFKGEISFMKKRWGTFLEAGDPYYNPNLSLDHEDFSFNFTRKNP